MSDGPYKVDQLALPGGPHQAARDLEAALNDYCESGADVLGIVPNHSPYVLIVHTYPEKEQVKDDGSVVLEPTNTIRASAVRNSVEDDITINGLDRKLESLEELVKTLYTQRAERDRQIEELKEESARQVKSIDTAREQLRLKDEYLERLEQQPQPAQVIDVIAAEEIEELKEDIKALHEMLDTAWNKVRDHIEENNRLTKQLETTRESLRGQTKRLQREENARREDKRLIENLKQGKLNLIKEGDRDRKRREEIENELRQARAESSSLRAELQDYKFLEKQNYELQWANDAALQARDRSRLVLMRVLEDMDKYKEQWTGGEPNYPAWLDQWPLQVAEAISILNAPGEREDDTSDEGEDDD